MSSLGSCIASNPDISGIGVRTAIYAQNILSFAPAVFALLDKKVSPTELDTLETQSTTILITAFAILVSTIVQALTEGITNYHGAIILNLSWMNNTNLFIYFLLYVHHRSGLRVEGTKQDAEANQGVPAGEATPDSPPKDRSDPPDTIRSIWISEITRALKNPVFIIGSLHLTLMAAVGLWLWSRPAQFGSSLEAPCSLSASLVILGRKVVLSSPGLRIWSLLIYSVLLIPVLNLIIPIIFFLGPIALYNRYRPTKISHFLSITQISTGLLVLAIVDIIILADTEVTLRNNKHLLIDGDDAAWTFGQTLALLLLLVPLRDLGETLLERRPRKVGKKLISASIDGKPEVVEHLMKQGPRTRAKNLSLRAAATNGHVEAVRILVEHGVNVHIKDSNGQTPMHLSAANGHTAVLKVLMLNGANANTTDRSGKAPIDLAVVGLHDEAIIHLLGGDVDEQETRGQKAIHWVAARGMLDTVEYLIKSGATLNEPDLFGRFPIHLATLSDHLDVVECLIKHGADVNAKALLKDDSDCSTLCIAAGKGYKNVVELLLKHGADLENDRTFGSPLYRAIHGEHTETVRCLCEHGAEVNVYGVGGYSPLSLAVGAGHTEIVKCLVEHGVYIDERLEQSANSILTDPRGLSILRRAVQAGHVDIVKCLVENGADMRTEDYSKDSLVHVAAEAGRVDILRVLVTHGAASDLNKTTYRGHTPLGRAVELGRVATVKCLLELGADVNKEFKFFLYRNPRTDRREYATTTPLDLAASNGFTKTAQCLIEHGADPNVRDKSHRTPLHAAARLGYLDTVKYLVEHGADFRLKDDNGRTPLEYAMNTTGVAKVVEYLRGLSSETTQDGSTETVA